MQVESLIFTTPLGICQTMFLNPLNMVMKMKSLKSLAQRLFYLTQNPLMMNQVLRFILHCLMIRQKRFLTMDFV